MGTPRQKQSRLAEETTLISVVVEEDTPQTSQQICEEDLRVIFQLINSLEAIYREKLDETEDTREARLKQAKILLAITAAVSIVCVGFYITALCLSNENVFQKPANILFYLMLALSIAAVLGHTFRNSAPDEWSHKINQFLKVLSVEDMNLFDELKTKINQFNLHLHLAFPDNNKLDLIYYDLNKISTSLNAYSVNAKQTRDCSVHMRHLVEHLSFFTTLSLPLVDPKAQRDLSLVLDIENGSEGNPLLVKRPQA